MTKTWMVRSGGDGLLIEEFLAKGIVSIGWEDLGDVSSINSYEELQRRYKGVYPDSSSGSVTVNCRQIWKFVNEMKEGHTVVTYDPNSRDYYFGEIKSKAFYDSSLQYKLARRVTWDETPISRDVLSIPSKNSMGSVLTVFQIQPDIVTELHRGHPGFISDEELQEIEETSMQLENAEIDLVQRDIVSKSIEFVKDKIVALSWQDTERLVAELMRAMGYKVRLTQAGPDMGSDILVSPDGLGMEEPRIKVEVKKRTKDKIGAPLIRSFIGGLRGADRGIYVATTGFSKDARIEAERANFPIRLIDLDLQRN